MFTEILSGVILGRQLLLWAHGCDRHTVSKDIFSAVILISWLYVLHFLFQNVPWATGWASHSLKNHVRIKLSDGFQGREFYDLNVQFSTGFWTPGSNWWYSIESRGPLGYCLSSRSASLRLSLGFGILPYSCLRSLSHGHSSYSSPSHSVLPFSASTAHTPGGHEPRIFKAFFILLASVRNFVAVMRRITIQHINGKCTIAL